MYSSSVGGSDSSHGKSYFTVLYEFYGVYTKKKVPYLRIPYYTSKVEVIHQ